MFWCSLIRLICVKCFQCFPVLSRCPVPVGEEFGRILSHFQHEPDGNGRIPKTEGYFMIFLARHPRGHEYLHGIQGRGVWISVCPDSALEVREAPLAPARLYCVAPLQLGPLPLVTYDFWLIGKECCQVRCRMQVKGTTARHERICHRQCFFIWLVMTWYDGMSFAAALNCFWEASKPGFNCGSAQHLHSSGLIARRQIWNVDVWPEVHQKSSVEMGPVFRNMSTYDISNLVLVWIIQLIR